MNAKEQVLEYVKKHNDGAKHTDEEFAGMMVKGGIVIDWTPSSVTSAKLRREGKTLIITETTKKEVFSTEARAFETIETTAEVLRVEL